MREAHARVRRHFKSAHFDETEPATGTFRREQFINRKLRTVCVAAGVDQQIAEQPVAQPRRRVAEGVEVAIQLLERDFEFVK